MNKDKKIPSTDEATTPQEEMARNDEVGYGRPPKHTQFKKGVSGNRSGRRKKARDLDAELSSELDSLITITDKGRRKRIPKVRGIFMQLANKALTGDTRAARIVLDYRLRAEERRSLSTAEGAKEHERINNIDELTHDELLWIAAGGDPKELLQRKTFEKKCTKRREIDT